MFQMPSDTNVSPLNPLPPVVWLLVAPIALVEAVLNLGARGIIGGPQAIGWRLMAERYYGFQPEIFAWMMQNHIFPAYEMGRFISYGFVHANFTHALFVCVFILAMGKMVASVFHAWAVLVVYFGAGILGALAYGLLAPGPMPLIGGYPSVYGLIGAFTFVLWVRLKVGGDSGARAFSLIGFLLGVQLVFGVLFGGGSEWIAEVAGFISGFGLSFVVSPGGWQHLLNRLRNR